MTERFFVDTNILVYVRDRSQPTKSAIASQWVDRLWRDGSGRTSVQVLKELYATLTKSSAFKMSPDAAWDDVRALLDWKPQPTSTELLLRAHKIERRYRINWWDSLIVSAAQLQDCSVLLTEDLQEGMHFDEVTVRNPFNQQVREPRATYSTHVELSPQCPLPERPRMRAA